MRQPSISQYLVSTCLHIIDEFNELYGRLSKDELKNIADSKFNEMDLTVKIGYPFQHSVHYTVGDSKSKIKKNHDLYIESKDFRIEVKFFRNWINNTGHPTQSGTWEQVQMDFEWLFDEIDKGNKDKIAFIIGWFNCVEHFSSLVQIGSAPGPNPPVNEERVRYFPFLHQSVKSPRTYDLVYDYSSAYVGERVKLIGRNGNYECIFLGQGTDTFHFALYY